MKDILFCIVLWIGIYADFEGMMGLSDYMERGKDRDFKKGVRLIISGCCLCFIIAPIIKYI